MASLCGRPALSSQVRSLTPIVSTTNVSPSHFPTEYPSQEGCGSLGRGRPSVKICRYVVKPSYSISIIPGTGTILYGYGSTISFGIPGTQYDAGSSLPRAPSARSFVSFSLHGWNGMLAVGAITCSVLVSGLHTPDRSGCPSAAIFGG